MHNTRIYQKKDSIVFCKTKDPFGGLSNMAAGFPIVVNNVSIRTSEALYQACKFPQLPDVQQEIISQRSPMAAKMKTKQHTALIRGDWFSIRVNVMRWCLRVKLFQNWTSFSALLLETEDLPIVELSHKDSFWGAKKTTEDELVGQNILGRLLMELRTIIQQQNNQQPAFIATPQISDFKLYNQPIKDIHLQNSAHEFETH